MYLTCPDCGKTDQHTEFELDRTNRYCTDCGGKARLTSGDLVGDVDATRGEDGD